MIEEILEQFKKSRVLIIGDVMLDKYIEGNANRLSPEAPVPVIAVAEERYVPGGAANVANNIVSLQGNASIVGLIGQDVAGSQLKELLQNLNIDISGLVEDPDFRTIEKIRIIAQRQQIARVDYEGSKHNGFTSLCESIVQKMSNADVVIVSDYNKGVINEKLMDFVRSTAAAYELPVIVDPKPPHTLIYKDTHLITPNLKEAEELTGIKYSDEHSIAAMGDKILHELNSSVIITRGELGMNIFEKGKNGVYIPTDASQVFDVSGAGDTVIATLGLCTATHLTLEESARIANYAAGIVVAKHGTATVSPEELTKRYYEKRLQL
jgi:D-beta-D-heptose 7-phosphate kinase/D-beta-D-heptose 1-phosphate adenosyltransferase